MEVGFMRSKLLVQSHGFYEAHQAHHGFSLFLGFNRLIVFSPFPLPSLSGVVTEFIARLEASGTSSAHDLLFAPKGIQEEQDTVCKVEQASSMVLREFGDQFGSSTRGTA
jgi:hypothetical protein